MDRQHQGRLSRRIFLGGAAGTALTAILAACGGSAATDTPKPAPTTAPAAAATTAPVAAATTAPTTAPAAPATAAPTTAPAAAATTAPTAAATQAPAATSTTAASSAAAGTPAAAASTPTIVPVPTGASGLAESTAVGTAVGVKPPDLTAKLSFKKLNAAFIPSEDAAKIFNDNKDLLAYLKQSLGVEVVGTVGTSYSAVIEAMRAKKVELAFFGPFSYILGHQETNAQAIIQGEDKDGKLAIYNSLIITTADSPLNSLADIKGKTFSFVDPASTSGHLVPSYTLLTKANLKETDYKPNYAGSHPASYQAVINKKVEAGAIASDIFEQGIAAGTIDKSKVKILDTSFAIPGSPVAVRGDLPKADQDLLQQVLLSINDQPKESALFTNFVVKGGFGVGTVKLRKGDDAAYDELRKIPPAIGIDIKTLK